MIKVRVYRCEKHPTWTMEASGPLLATSLKVFCPLCRDEFFEQHIGLPICTVEERERKGERT